MLLSYSIERNEIIVEWADTNSQLATVFIMYEANSQMLMDRLRSCHIIELKLDNRF